MKAPLLPQLDEAIAFLQADIAALRAGEKDRSLPSLAVSIAAGDAPLPEPQFAPLLSLWTPKSSTISTELAMLVDQFEAAKQHEEKGKAQAEDQDAVEPPKVLNSALERVKGRRRPRTRPRRRFEDPGEGDASQSTSDGTATPSPRVAAAVEKKTVVIETEEKAVETEEETAETEEKAAETEEETAETEEKAAETEEKAAETEEKTTETQVVVDRDQKMEEIQDEAKKEEVEKSSVEDVKISESDVEKETGESENVEMEDEEKEEETEAVVVEKVKEVIEDKVEGVPNPAKEEAEAALASLKALRKTMLLDVLSKIVSVAKSKDVDPAMFSEKGADVEKTKDKELVDLKKIHDHVTNGKICEWAEFAEQVYLFCQHVVSDAEEREQPEARRKGVELLHFARTLTETLRKGSVKKEASLVEKIREADAAATESAAHNEPEELRPSTDKEEAAPSNQDNDVTKPTTQGSPVPSPFTPSRVSKRIRKRSSEIDGTSSAAPSPSPQNPRKRTRGASSAASASEDVSGSESHDASASEADLKSRGRNKPTESPVSETKFPAKRAKPRRRRPVMPATRISSRQQKRRAAAAAAAAADSTAEDEEHSGVEGHQSAVEKEDDGNERENEAEEETGGEDQDEGHEEEQETPKKKRAATKPSRSRKKGSRKSR